MQTRSPKTAESLSLPEYYREQINIEKWVARRNGSTTKLQFFSLLLGYNEIRGHPIYKKNSSTPSSQCFVQFQFQLSGIVSDAIFMIQFIRIRFHHVNEEGENFFFFNWYRLEMLHHCLQIENGKGISLVQIFFLMFG